MFFYSKCFNVVSGHEKRTKKLTEGTRLTVEKKESRKEKRSAVRMTVTSALWDIRIIPSVKVQGAG